MLRINELKLPLDHKAAALEAAVLAHLKISHNELIRFDIFRRGYDARRRDRIQLVYTLDVETTDDAAVLGRLGPAGRFGSRPGDNDRAGAAVPRLHPQRFPHLSVPPAL
jgi:hypothetical protein